MCRESRAMARPSRAHEKRAELIAAAREAVLQRGVIGLRLRDVAEQAEMSTSSVHYYFPTLGDLLLAVQREAVERFCVDREDAARREPDPRRRLLGMMRTGIPTGKADTGFILVLELAMYARRDPAYAGQPIRLCGRQIALYPATLEAARGPGGLSVGAEPAPTRARLRRS